MNDLLYDFCHDIISLKELYLVLKTYNDSDLIEFNRIIIDKIDDYNKDKLMFICLLLNTIFNFDLSNFSYDIHNFISDSISLSNDEIIFFLTDDNIFMYEKNSVLYIINNTNNIVSIVLPKEYQNSTLFCVNCGDDISINCTIDVYNLSFYIIEK